MQEMIPPSPTPTQPTCPQCHTVVKETDYFCFNCGMNLHPAPPSVSILDIIVLFFWAILLPPFGVIKGIPYAKQSDTKSRIIGISAMVISAFLFVYSLVWFYGYIKEASDQASQQLQMMQGF